MILLGDAQSGCQNHFSYVYPLVSYSKYTFNYFWRLDGAIYGVVYCIHLLSCRHALLASHHSLHHNTLVKTANGTNSRSQKWRLFEFLLPI